jgi:hypothetical protein
MPGNKFIVLTTVAILGVIVTGWLGGGAAASGIDPCYNWCVILGNRAGATTQQCNNRCRASKRYACDTNCSRQFGNLPSRLSSCQAKCFGLSGPYTTLQENAAKRSAAAPSGIVPDRGRRVDRGDYRRDRSTYRYSHRERYRDSHRERYRGSSMHSRRDHGRY